MPRIRHSLLWVTFMTSCATVSRDSLLGADFDAVRARYGCPVSCSAGGGVLTFAYPGPTGVIADAVVVVDGIVVRVDPSVQTAPPVIGPAALLGAHVETAVEQLGIVREVVTSNSTSELVFDGASVTVCEGYVVGVRELLPAITASR